MSYQEAIVCGRMGRDPEVRNTSGGLTVANISVATDEYRGGENETTWHRVVLFGKQAELTAQMTQKGTMVLVRGRMRHSKYTDKEGIERRSFEITGDYIKFLGDLKPKGETNATDSPW